MKGVKVGFYSLHEWVRRNNVKHKKCQKCSEERKLDWANISGEYKRDLNDYVALCRKCHMISDGRIFNLKPREFLKRGVNGRFI